MEADFRIYEGNNINNCRKLIKITLKQCSMGEAMRLVSDYTAISNALSYIEKIISLEENEEKIEAWISFTDEETSISILNGLIAREDAESLLDRLSAVNRQGLLWSVVKAADKKDIPVIKLCSNLYQIGYGKRSVVIGENYQSFDNNINVIISRDKIALDRILKCNNIPGIDITNKECATAKYRVISYKGRIMLVFNNEKLEEGMTEWKKEWIVKDNVSLEHLVIKTFNTLKINAMYIDLSGEMKVIDAGSIFDIAHTKKDAQELSNYLINALLNDDVGLIPIISVTGTNGKTTTVRLIYYLLQKLGFNTGLASTGGVFIGDKQIREGDTTGFLSAREILMDNEVEVAVLETARGGIVKNGLGYEQAQAAVITSITEDHIGMGGIRDIGDLAKVKGVILRELNKDGKVIVRAQEILVRLTKNMRNVCLFETEINQYMKEHIERGEEAMYLEDNWIIHSINGESHRVMKVNDIPFTHYGKSMSNVRNIMAAIAAVLTVYNNYEILIKTIGELECNLKFNPGRQNVIPIGNSKLLIDYGHNSEAMTEVYSVAKSYKPSRITTVISAPGDRMDIYIKQMGKVAAQNSDYIIIKELEDLRGRKLGETAKLVEQGALEQGFDKSRIKIIYREAEAVEHAINNAIEGEMIVVYTQVMEISLEVINEQLSLRNRIPVVSI